MEKLAEEFIKACKCLPRTSSAWGGGRGGGDGYVSWAVPLSLGVCGLKLSKVYFGDWLCYDDRAFIYPPSHTYTFLNKREGTQKWNTLNIKVYFLKYCKNSFKIARRFRRRGFLDAASKCTEISFIKCKLNDCLKIHVLRLRVSVSIRL